MSLTESLSDPTLRRHKKLSEVIFRFGYLVIPVVVIGFFGLEVIYKYLFLKDPSFDILIGILIFLASFSALCFTASTSAKIPYKERYHLAGEKFFKISLVFAFGCFIKLLDVNYDWFLLNSDVFQSTLRLISKIVSTLYFLNAMMMLLDATIFLYEAILVHRFNDGLLNLYKVYDKTNKKK